MSVWLDIVLNPTVLIAALVIGTLGEVVKRAVLGKGQRLEAATGWRRWYSVTLPAQPVVVGLLLGLIPWLPAVDALTKPGYEFAGRLATYALSGVVCKVSYDTIIATLRRALRSSGSPDSMPPPPQVPAGDATPPQPPSP